MKAGCMPLGVKLVTSLVISGANMARQPQSGLPFLIRRSDSGKFVYWRSLPKEMAEHFCGEFNLPWERGNRPVTAPAIVKISLKTGDEQTARARWGQVHAQVETLFKAAVNRLKETAEHAAAQRQMKMVRSLSSEEVSAIALQTRHDILAAHDQAWINPDAMSPREQIIARMMVDDGTAHCGNVPDRARAVVQFLDKRSVQTALKTRNPGIMDQDVELRPVGAKAIGGGASKNDGAIVQLPGELSRRLQDNGLELPKDSPDRRQLGNYPPHFQGQNSLSHARVAIIVWNGFAPVSFAVSMVVRTSASACAAHMAL